MSPFPRPPGADGSLPWSKRPRPFHSHLCWQRSGQLQSADGKGGHGNHGDGIEDRLTHQLRVVGHHLGAHRCLFADYGGGGGLHGRGSAHLRVGVAEGVCDVAGDGHRLGVERGQVLAEVSHRVHGYVADGLVSGR